MSDFERTIGFADVYGTRVTVMAYDGDDENERGLQVWVGVGQSGSTGFPTPEAARQFAAALLDAADRVEKAAAE